MVLPSNDSSPLALLFTSILLTVNSTELVSTLTVYWSPSFMPLSSSTSPTFWNMPPLTTRSLSSTVTLISLAKTKELAVPTTQVIITLAIPILRSDFFLLLGFLFSFSIIKPPFPFQSSDWNSVSLQFLYKSIVLHFRIIVKIRIY